MNEEYYISLITKFFSGNCTISENAEIEKWVAQSDDNRKMFQQYESAWKNSEQINESFSPDINKASARFKSRISSNTNNTISINRKRKMQWVAAAGIILAIASFVSIWLNQQSVNWIEVVSHNEVKTLVLPDSSTIWMNKNCRISYPEDFKIREVILVGEAFFDITRNPDLPFTISCNGSEIEVLGTSFNVKSDTIMQKVEVVVVSGKVSFANKEKSDKVFLNPGDLGVYNKTDKTLSSNHNYDPNFIAWKDNRLLFDNVEMIDVVNTLSQHFDRNIEIEPGTIEDCSITSIFDNQTLDEIIEELEILLNIQTNYTDESILISGNACK